MFDAGIKAFSLTVLLLAFSIQWQQCVSTAEDFPSDASSAGDDFISYSQQSLSTENALLGDNFNDLDNYDQNESEKENENDTVDEDSEVMPSEKTEQKSFKDIEDRIIYGDTDGDVIVKEFNGGRWEDDRKESIDTLRTTVSSSTTSATTAVPSTTSTLKPAGDESDVDGEEDVDEFRAPRSRTNDYKDWLTNRKRRAHSTFEKYKAYHRNYRRYGHKGHKKAFGRYKKYEHHRSKHKNSQLHHHQHQHRNHFHYSTFDDKPYYQGQVSYYGQDDDTMDDTGIGVVVADKPFHLPAKMRSYQHYGQYRRGKGGDGNVANSYRSDKYPNRSVKWPHLQRIEYQITKDERRKLDPDDNDEDQLPPYIRKYNRRNKQLLDLLEGTMLPSTTTTVMPVVPARVQYSEYEATGGGKDNSRKHDGVGRKSGRSHFHNHRNPKWIMEDLFEEQRANPNNPNIDEDQYLNDSAMTSQPPKSSEVKGSSQNGYKNTFKGKDFSDEDEDSDESLSKANEDENTILIEKNELPSGSVVNNSLNPGKKSSAGGEKSQIASSYHPKDLSESHSSAAKAVAAPVSAIDASPTETLKISPKANQFIYHRVASPRSVGTGTNIIGVDGGARKQRLPFVAITDRRLETSKMQKLPADFRQNHLPLP